MTMKRNLFLAGAMVLASAGLARAEMAATAINDMTIYTGPGTEYPAVGVATRGSDTILDGCVASSQWCRVDVNGMRGWVYAQYLQMDRGGTQVIVDQNEADLNIPVVTYETATPTGPAEPAPGDELLGPVGSVETIEPPRTVTTYVESNPGRTVQIGGDVVVGAQVPGTVTFQEIPDYQYRYARINDRPVLVDPGTRRIVYVYN